MRKFTLSLTDLPHPMSVEVRAYKKTDLMRRAIGSQFTEPQYAADALAMFIGIQSQDPDSIGILFFALDSLSIEIIAHESAHAALEYASRHNLGDPYRTSDGLAYGPANETICEITGMLTSSTFRHLAALAPDGIDL
jgi:hypothetical protein